MEASWWVLTGSLVWLAVALGAGLLIGGAARMRDRVGAPVVIFRSRWRDARRLGAVPSRGRKVRLR